MPAILLAAPFSGQSYMLYGAESKSMLEFLADHHEKKVLRNLLTSLQQVEEGGRRKGGGGRGQQQGKGGRDQHQQAQSASHPRQVTVDCCCA